MLVNHAKGKCELDLHTIGTWIGASPGLKLTIKSGLSTTFWLRQEPKKRECVLSVRVIMLRMPLKEFLKNSEESRGF